MVPRCLFLFTTSQAQSEHLIRPCPKKNQDRGSAEPSAIASGLQAAPRRPLGKPKTHTGEGTPGNECKAKWRSADPAQASCIRPLHSESILERLSAGFRVSRNKFQIQRALQALDQIK